MLIGALQLGQLNEIMALFRSVWLAREEEVGDIRMSRQCHACLSKVVYLLHCKHAFSDLRVHVVQDDELNNPVRA